ncbi:MAG: hypothetical protein FWF94_03625 [Oscillospiraceae bacterium]|nr:hypothetical protein [Oscillospiraceae bacterium]
MFRRYILPLLLGLALGAISVLIGHTPKTIVAITGMRVIGNQIGYSLGILAMTYINSDKWLRGFVAGSLMNFVATVVYYVAIYTINALSTNVTGYSFEWVDLILWTVLGAGCSALAASAVRFGVYGKSKLIRYSAAFVTHSALMLAVLLFQALPFFIRLHSDALTTEDGVARNIYEIFFALFLISAMFIIFYKRNRRDNETD